PELGDADVAAAERAVDVRFGPDPGTAQGGPGQRDPPGLPHGGTGTGPHLPEQHVAGGEPQRRIRRGWGPADHHFVDVRLGWSVVHAVPLDLVVSAGAAVQPAVRPA